MVVTGVFNCMSISWCISMVIIMQVVWLFDMWCLESVVVVSHGWAEMSVVVFVIMMSSCPFSMMISVSMVSIQLCINQRRFMVCASPVFGMMRSFLMRSGPEGIVQSIFVGWFETWVNVSCGGFMCLLKSMSFGSGMSEWCFVELNITSMLSDSLMVMRVWEFMWLHDKRSLMWLDNFSMGFTMSISETVIESMVSFSVASFVVSNFMVFRGEMAILSLPFVSMAMIDNMIETVASISMVETMSKSMIDTVISIMWHHVGLII